MHIRPLRQLRRRDILPAFAGIAGDVQQAVIAARPQHTVFMRGCGQRRYGRVDFGSAHIAVDGTAADTQGSWVGAGQVGADGLPTRAFIAGFVDAVATDIQVMRREGRKQDRVSPSEALLQVVGCLAKALQGHGRNQAQLFAGVVIALQGIAATGRAADCANEDDIVIIGLGSDEAAFARARDEAILPQDGAFAAAAGHGDGAVVLLRAIDMIGVAVVRAEAIKLGGGLIEDTRPARAAIQGHTGTAIVALHHAQGILGVDPQVVIVAVRSADLRE